MRLVRESVAATVTLAMAVGGCGGGRLGGDDRRLDSRRQDAAAPAPPPLARPFVWSPQPYDVPCTEKGCGEPYRREFEFDDEAELNGAGWRRVTGAQGKAAFGGGRWTAPAGTYDEWLYGPTEWGRIANRARGWAITATLDVQKKKASCTPNTRGPGLRVSGDLGGFAVTLLPAGLELAGSTSSITPGAPYTIRIEGRGQGMNIEIDGKPVSAGGISRSGNSVQPAIEFGQLGCSDYESRWDRLVVEANLSPCTACRPGEHQMIAAVRQMVPDRGTHTEKTASAYPGCIAYAAIDHAIRTLLVENLVQAGQTDRANQLTHLDPLVDSHSFEVAQRVLGPMGLPPERPGCDPVESADECNYTEPETLAAPPLVEFVRQQLPYGGWVDYAASGREAMLDAAVAIHVRAGADALAGLLEFLTVAASPGGTCAFRG